MIEYNLPDILLLEYKNKQFLTWIPDKTYLVLGASNRAEESLFLKNVKLDEIPVLKRPSGGQTVMLTPNNLIIAVVFPEPKDLLPKDIFNQINTLIILALEKAGIQNLTMKGISDIAIAGKKILGSAIYRNKNALLYHAVLNIAEPAATFEKYLKHPGKEPDYRQGRTHNQFVTSLKENGYCKSAHHLETVISDCFKTSSLIVK